MFKLIPYVRKSLLRNKRRTVLTVLSVAVSLFLLGILFAVYGAFFFQQVTPAQTQRLITRHKVSLTQLLPAYYGKRMEEVEGVEAAVAEMWFGGVYIDSRPEHFFSRFAVDPERIFDLYSEFEVPPDQLQEFLDDRQGMAVGKLTAERVGLKLGQRITIQGDIFPVDLELRVRAIFDGPNADVTYFHRDYLNEGMPEGIKDVVGFYGIRTANADVVNRVAAEIDEIFRNSPQPTKTETEAAFQLGFINQIGNIKMFLMSIAAAIVFTIMLVSANTMAMSVRERIREVGVLKTLGFASDKVLILILAEAALIALVGGLLGVAAAWATTLAVSEIMAGFPMVLRFPLWGLAPCLAAALGIGVFSALVPALSASRTRITDALRHAG